MMRPTRVRISLMMPMKSSAFTGTAVRCLFAALTPMAKAYRLAPHRRASRLNPCVCDSLHPEAGDTIEARVTPCLGVEGATAFMAEYRNAEAQGVGTPEQIVERPTAMKKRAWPRLRDPLLSRGRL